MGAGEYARRKSVFRAFCYDGNVTIESANVFTGGKIIFRNCGIAGKEYFIASNFKTGQTMQEVQRGSYLFYDNDGTVLCRSMESFDKEFVLVKPIELERPKIVTLCGSTRFKEEFEAFNKKYTLLGYIVLSCGVFGHSGDVEGDDPEIKAKLDELYLHKILMSDLIVVINKDGYIGEGCKKEIEFAEKNNVPVKYAYCR